MKNNKKQQEIDKANEGAYAHDYESMWDEHYNAKVESSKNLVKIDGILRVDPRYTNKR